MPKRATESSEPGHGGWTFLSNHGHVLICLAQNPEVRLRDVADQVGITERAVQSIVGDLEASGAITRHKEGRCNRYQIHQNVPLRHPVEAHCTLRDLLALAEPRKRRAPRRA